MYVFIADINECSSNTACQHHCTNTLGSYHCSCNEGHALSEDGHSCDSIVYTSYWGELQ